MNPVGLGAKRKKEERERERKDERWLRKGGGLGVWGSTPIYGHRFGGCPFQSRLIFTPLSVSHFLFITNVYQKIHPLLSYLVFKFSGVMY